MISMSELLSGNKLEDLPQEHQDNLAKLQIVANKVRTLWNQPMTVTTGYRTMEHHIEIYKEKAEKAGNPFDINKVPMHSKHLIGCAVDISDPMLAITHWLRDNPQIMEDCEIFCEAGNKNWVHIQFLPFGSYHAGGTRWFLP